MHCGRRHRFHRQEAHEKSREPAGNAQNANAALAAVEEARDQNAGGRRTGVLRLLDAVVFHSNLGVVRPLRRQTQSARGDHDTPSIVRVDVL